MTETYDKGKPILCAGCGHFGAKNAIQFAMEAAGIEMHEALVLAGIGCSGTIQNNIGAYGYHSMHGRVVPTAIGASLANPDLTIIAAGGDGDGYAIGGGHFMHALKRNPNILYVVMNNGVYGLTKGQDSPTRENPGVAPEECALDSMMLGLSIQSSTFLARAITTHSDQLNALLVKGLEHVKAGRGMAFVEVLSPCVTYHDTYPQWLNEVIDVDQDPDYAADNRAQAFGRVCSLTQEGKIPIGMIYAGEHKSLQASIVGEVSPFASLHEKNNVPTREHLDNVLAAYTV
jgi:2-oxoglutarate ferredoxin oxidoreductase subunit beta